MMRPTLRMADSLSARGGWLVGTPFIVESVGIQALITERWMYARAALWLVGALMSASMWAVWRGKGAFRFSEDDRGVVRVWL